MRRSVLFVAAALVAGALALFVWRLMSPETYFVLPRAATSGTERSPAAAQDGQPPSARTDPALAEGLRVEFRELRRISRDIVEVRLLLINRDGSRPVDLGARFAEKPEESGSLSGAFLTIEGGLSRHFVLRDSAGQPACSSDVARLSPGEQREVWIRFAAPGRAAMRVSLHLKDLPPVENIELAGAP